MKLEKIIWTALPHGLTAEKRLRVSLHVAPRLRNSDGSDTPGKLGEFPAFKNWPARLNELKFTFEIPGVASGKATPEALADAKLWDLLFPPETPVEPHVFDDHAASDLHAFPVRPLLKFFKKTYGAVAAAGSNYPSIHDASGPLAPFVPLQRVAQRITDSESVYTELARAHQDPKTRSDGKVVFEHIADSSLPADEQAMQNHFFQACRFYHRPGSQRPDFPENYVEPPPQPHEFEFHEMVSSLADHPTLLRRLGLVVDLVLDVDAGAVPDTGVIRIVPKGDLPEKPPVTPWTSFEHDSRWFGARSEDNFRMKRGILRLNKEYYDVFQVDVDGAALQAVNFSVALDELKNPDHLTETSPSTASIPALRSAGLALARTERADALLEDLKARRAKNQAIETGGKVTLYAEDLVRGYRVDIYDEKTPAGSGWYSLHRRVSKHTFDAPPDGVEPNPMEVTDEGYIKATAASSENQEHPTPSDDLYLHETVTGWDGWSLAAPRPGKRIVEPGEGDTPESHIARYDPEAGNPFPVVTRTEVESGTLPRLRVGHLYRMRIRTVDLAGNSLPYTQSDLPPDEPDLISEAQRYLRFEPIPSPAILRRHLDTEGESVENLVIRSNLGVSAADYPTLPEVEQALKDSEAPHTYAEDSQRHLAPPKASEQMAEQHGKLESAFGSGSSGATTALHLALREEGTFLDETIVDIATGQKTIVQSKIETFPEGTPLPKSRGAGFPQGAYAYYPHSDPSPLLPYLPDPLAVGVALVAYDYKGKEVFYQKAHFDGEWPALGPFRLRLSEGNMGAEFVGGVLEVRLPKAEVVWVRLSSLFPDGRLEDLAIWDWIPAADKTSGLKAVTLEGRHWMFSPFRNLTFTHAVQQPLSEPDMTKVLSSRSLGNTYASFRGPIQNHSKSTGRLDVIGEWTEDVDLLTEDKPNMKALGTAVPHRAQAFGFEVRRGDDQAEVAFHKARHEFGDTKYRRIVYHSVATTRFREFFPAPLTSVPENIQLVEAIADASNQPKSQLEYHIPSSARPATPEIVYMLPTFRWEKKVDGTKHSHVRRGNGVRVWLRRPWFSSGDGEQLGVVLETAKRYPVGWHPLDEHLIRAKPKTQSPLTGYRGFLGGLPNETLMAFEPPMFSEDVSLFLDLIEAHIKNMLRPYVTDWGSDPIWQSAQPLVPPTIGDFPRRTGEAAGLTIAELPGGITVSVAAHDVHFDSDRKLWYCDIEIEAGNSYFPFVRLALARYQPHSLPNAHLSRVVMGDFIQLAPDRSADVVLSDESAAITVQGYAGRNIVANAAPTFLHDRLLFPPSSTPNTTMRVAVQRRIPGVPGDLGWERLGSEVTLSAATSGFHVTWTSTVKLPAGVDEMAGKYRLLITESETFERDAPQGRLVSTSQLGYLRERVVYADVFEL